MKQDLRTFQQALDYIYSYIDFSLTRNLRYSEEKFNLARMIELMDLLGNPQDHYDIIHIAGTKGKGSTCAMVASILAEQGYKTGFYSSPHMIDFNERMKIDNAKISNSEFVGLVNELRPKFEKVRNISTFEITTAIAFQYFYEKRVDIAVIEVGMGGRLDATNIVKPLMTAITSISLDHTKILGDTIAKISREKAGIIKDRTPVVVGKQDQTARKVILDAAKKHNSPVIDVEQEFKWDSVQWNMREQEFKIIPMNESGEPPSGYRMKLLGDHQLNNALNAYAIIKNLPDRIKVNESVIEKGFLNVDWPGRFEVINQNPLVIIDGAHNPFSFEKLAQTLEKYLPHEEVTLIFGASEDKDVRQMIDNIKPFIKRAIFTSSDHPRAMSEKDFKAILSEDDINYEQIDLIVENIMKDEEGIYLAAGSIFVAGAVKDLIKSKVKGKS